ncbi:hypothetical protein BC832DRAFT_564316 [Gaertneriomyces semiglobifer]|nr:hypothetical protein BC832DRAFT_564316 [Gaertneriomyces semiglobifer]
MSKTLQATWRSDRDAQDLVANLSLGVRQMTLFLTKFDTHARSQLASLNEQLTYLERHLAFLEAKTGAVMGAGIGLNNETPKESQSTLLEPSTSVPPPPPPL